MSAFVWVLIGIWIGVPLGIGITAFMIGANQSTKQEDHNA